MFSIVYLSPDVGIPDPIWRENECPAFFASLSHFFLLARCAFACLRLVAVPSCLIILSKSSISVSLCYVFYPSLYGKDIYTILFPDGGATGTAPRSVRIVPTLQNGTEVAEYSQPNSQARARRSGKRWRALARQLCCCCGWDRGLLGREVCVICLPLLG